MEIKKQSILIVDDEPTNIEILNELLGDEYEIFFATNGKKAIEIATKQNPDLILLDIIMPEMDGYKACSYFKADPVIKDIPVIFITMLDQDESETKGLEIGAVDYITKPFNPAIVNLRVKNHLEMKQQRDILARLATIDGLTGTPNRRAFDEHLDREWRRALRNQSLTSLIMMDIDHFKAYNDHYGHAAGDDCLRKVAFTLSDSMKRPVDLVARYGGEEFACILPETNAVGALHIAEKLRLAVSTLNMIHCFSSAGDHVTLSLGVATIHPSSKMSQMDFIKAADQCLYEAKKEGRNRVISFKTNMILPML